MFELEALGFLGFIFGAFAISQVMVLKKKVDALEEMLKDK